MDLLWSIKHRNQILMVMISSISSRPMTASMHHPVYTATSNAMKKNCVTLHVFACMYKLMYTYVYTYNHTNMFLGCLRRGPKPWYGLGSPKPLRNRKNCQVSQYYQFSYYL